MRKRPSGVDKDIPVFEFAFGIEELRLLLGIAQKAKKNLPEILELTPTKHRLGNIISKFSKTLEEYKKS